MKSRGRICGRIRQDQFDHVIKTNRKNASVLKTLGVFILGLATVTTSNATLLPLTSSKVEQLNTLVYEFENLGSNFVKQDSIFTFSGIVVDPASESELPSVNISLKGTDLGTITDASGKFEFVVTPEQLKNSKNTLVFSFIGFKTTEIELSNRSITDMKIEMSTDVVWLGEIRIPWYKRLWWTITSPFRNG